MIRLFEKGDLDAVMELWLAGNLQAHPFVLSNYWRDNMAAVSELLPQSTVYVEEQEGEIRGFVGLDGTYIAGLFVADRWRSHGVGSELLDRLKAEYDALSLHVYQKNQRAVRFYLRQGFAVAAERLDGATGEMEYEMRWDRA